MTDNSIEPADISDDEERTPWNEEKDPDGYTREDITPKDWFLDITLNFVLGFNDEHEGNSMGLTVESGGVVVSGLAITRAEWITETVKLYAQAGAEETGSYIEKIFRQVHDKGIERAKIRGEADLPSAARKFLHMKDVRLGVGDTWTQVPLWRGNLEDITGWSMGAWNPKREPSSEE